MSEDEKEAETPKKKEVELEWRKFSREMPGKAVVVRSYGLSFDVEVAGRKIPGMGFVLEEVRPGEILARIYYNGHDHYGVVRLRGQVPGLPTFIPSPIDC